MFWTRLFSGILLLIIAITTLSFGNIILNITLLVISLIGYRELTKALLCADSDKKWNTLEILGFIGIVAYYLSVYATVYTGREIWLIMCIVMFFMAQMGVYVITFPRFQAKQVVASVFAFLYAPVMLSFIYLTRETTVGIYVVWLILISSWGCDTCAYAVGKLIGKKKIFPVLSPNKSLEGCVGGVLGAALIGGLYGHFFVEEMIAGQNMAWAIAFICAVGAVMSMLGDLAASAIKRNHDIKDYGKLIPGHGGIMDRFDSVIVTAPMVYFLTVLLLGA
ncbi:MAG: phosphatidate cytidylyltransferase [Acetatifactor sp.]|jgi:phosphatidate cytidylyltransferase|nr:phosphatidate cytidylyltransferase [Acetatifactor sp.]